MKAARMLAAVGLALLAQTLVALVGGGRLAVDLVLVTVAWIGLTLGPGFGLAAGTLGGLGQDALGSGVVGVGGLAKTVVGYLAGVIGAQFIVAQMLPRFLVFLGATAVQVFVIVGLDVLLGGGIGAVPPIGAMARQALGNAVIGVALFQVIELLPGAVERRRLARSRLRVGRLRE